MNIVQIQSRVQELPNSPQTMQYLNAAMNGQVTTVPPYIAAAELKRRETEGMMDQLAKGAAQAQQTTVKDQLQQKMGIMALMGQQQPPQPPQIPQPAPPEQQPQAAGIDSLPVKEDMFGMAGGGIVSFQSGGGTGGYNTAYDRMNQRNDAEAAQRVVTQPPDIRVLTRLYQQNPALAQEVALNAGPAGAALLQRVIQSAQSTGPRLGSVPAEREGERAAQRQAALQPAPANQGSGSSSEQDAINAALKAVGASTSKLPAMAPAVKPAAAAKPPGPRPLAAARPPAGSGISLADLNPGASPNPQADALDMDPAMQRMKQLATAANPYGGTQESQEDFIKRRNQGILSQMPGGKTPYETSEARLKEIEARRAKEDTEYADSNKGRQLDNLLTMISGMGRGSFGNAGMQGIQAVQKVERSQREEDLKRKDMRDQQNMKLMEIRALNDQAQYAQATGNVTEFERLKQEIKKLENEYAFKQANLSKDVATLGSTARARDTESADKARDRASQERRARMGFDARAESGGGKQQLAELKALQTSLKGQLDIAQKTFNKAEISKINADLAKVNAAIAKMAGLDTMSTAPGAGSPGGTPPDVQKLLDKYGGK